MQVAIYSCMDDLVSGGCVAIIKRVYNGSWKFLVGCDDDENVPIGLHPPEECSGSLPLHNHQPTISLPASCLVAFTTHACKLRSTL